jgi:hypothetical protein
MYCPNCGQQQISAEVRFCSRCGLPLSGLAEWLAGGRLSSLRTIDQPPDPDSPRRKGIRRAAKLMFFSGALLPVFLAICLAIEEPGPMFFPFVLLFASIVWMLYARLFSSKTAPAPVLNYAAPTPALGSNPARAPLPPATNTSIPFSGRQQVRTNELAQPRSVTEHTTKLLDNE